MPHRPHLIDSKEFIIDLFVIPLEGYDMVLTHAQANLMGL
jgi:hypothetical protein